MRYSLDEVVSDALLHGYNFNELVHNLKEKEINIKEYIYGYGSSEYKISYLESMANDTVEYCDRIHIFKDEMNDFIKEFEAMPLFKIFHGFEQEEIYNPDGSVYDASILMVVGINDTTKEAFIRKMEYSYGYDEFDEFDEYDELTTWGADVNYNTIRSIIDIYGSDHLIEKVGDLMLSLKKERSISIP